MPRSRSLVLVLAVVTIGACGPDVTEGENPLPSVSSLAPDTVLVGDSLELTVTGTGFVEQSAIRLRGVDLVTTWVSASGLRATLRPSDLPVPESASVAVFTPEPGGGLSNAVTLLVTNPVPTLTALSPDTAGVGGSAFPIILTGSGFNLSSRVLWNGAERFSEPLAGDRLRIRLGGAELDSGGFFPVSVFNPPPGGGTSESLTFTMFNPFIYLTRMEPDTVLASWTPRPVPVTVYGEGIRPGAKLLVRRQYLDAIATDTSLSATIPAFLLLDNPWGRFAATVAVSAVNPSPDRGPAAPVTLTIANPVPELDSVTPRTIPAGAPGPLEYWAWGSGYIGFYEEGNFYNTTYVLVDGAPAKPMGGGESVLLLWMSGIPYAAGDTIFIAVQNPAPGGGISATVPIEVVDPQAAVTGFKPTAAPAGSPDTTVPGVGSGFTARTGFPSTGRLRPRPSLGRRF